MRGFLFKSLLVMGMCVWVMSNQARAFVPVDDPQYIVVNFSSIILLDWGVPEETWQAEVKPKIISEINELKHTMPAGSAGRKLAWSTLHEFMNTPLDEPSEHSYYAVKMRRIMEIAEELDFPLFIPLNGYQWWDELPELYNWWDSDGTITPEVFFKRQRTKDFKARFIAGYNPENKWNVEWQDYETPMKLNWRNWGGGGFRLAPPPNLVAHSRTTLTYRKVLEGRLAVIFREVEKKLAEWEKEGKQHLFAGLSIGTEISLNASVTAKDEFEPYGYRAIQDTLCENNPTCGTTQDWEESKIQETRKEVVNRYLLDLTTMAYNRGIPKQRLYTHVWGEADPDEPRFAPYVEAPFTQYSRPGMSVYGHAQDPLGFEPWQRALSNAGLPAFAIPEYGLDRGSLPVALESLKVTLDSPINPAKMVVLYNWGEYKQTAALTAVTEYLEKEPVQPLCQIPEIVPLNPRRAYAPNRLRWNYLEMTKPWPTDAVVALHLLPQGDASASAQTIDLPLDTTQYDTVDLPTGEMAWYIEAKGCLDHKWVTSAPHIVYKPEPLPELTVTFWDRFYYWLSTWWPRFRYGA